jgi:enoyl-CoA hydratase
MSAVRVLAQGAALRITLDRPEALNALTLDMVRELQSALDRADNYATVRAVFLDGSGDRAFCAGGDIVALRDSALAGDGEARRFWEEEYALNARIAGFGTPIVAFMDGVVMGGGIGLAGHASHRVATERLVSAMPEVGIGFAPDVGGSWLLSRAPGELGTHLALTGARLGAGDAILTGLADHHVPADAREALWQRLAAGEDPDAAIAALARPAPAAPLAAARAWIDAAYAGDDAGAIVAALRARPEDDARAAADAIAQKSPTSVCVALASLRRAARLETLRDCLDQELRVSVAFTRHPDFPEGIRAQVVDKDRAPRWEPPALEDVDPEDVAAFFAPLEVTA